MSDRNGRYFVKFGRQLAVFCMSLSVSSGVVAAGSLCVFTRGQPQNPLANLEAPTEAAIKDVADVMTYLGYDARIPIFAGPVANAAAYPPQAGRDGFIVYNPDFLTRLFEINDWAATSVIAHEIGHHLAIDASHPNSHRRELAADEISGCAMARMGATLEDATAAMLKGLPTNSGSPTHPGTRQRINAIETAYRRCQSE